MNRLAMMALVAFMLVAVGGLWIDVQAQRKEISRLREQTEVQQRRLNRLPEPTATPLLGFDVNRWAEGRERYEQQQQKQRLEDLEREATWQQRQLRDQQRQIDELSRSQSSGNWLDSMRRGEENSRAWLR